MAILSAVPELTPAKLTAEQILERMPNSRADELQGIHKEWSSTYQALLRLSQGQLIRLLPKEARRPLDETLALLWHMIVPLSNAIPLRLEQQVWQLNSQQLIQRALTKAFPALAEFNRTKPNHQTLLQVARWMLIAKTDLYFSWLLTPSGNLDFFEQEQPRLLHFLKKHIAECIEQDPPFLQKQVMQVIIKKLLDQLSRPLNKTETVVFKRIQEELAVELSANIVLLNPKGKSTQQGECT